MIRPLTSLRFFAALMVVAHHYWGFTVGYSGVSFFYVLSGYVLTINYRDKVDSAAERRSFWFKRFARIYPLYLLTMLLCIPFGSSHVAAFFNVTALQSWIPVQSVYFSFDQPAWSISDEAFFYAAFPALLAILTPAPIKRAAIGGAAVLGLAIASAIVAPQSLLVAPTHFIFYIFPPTRLVEFAFGIALALCPLRPVGLGAEIAALTATGAGLIAAYAPIPGSLSASVIFWPGAVLMVGVFSASEGPLARLLSYPVLVLLGEASFALYMIHYPLLRYHLFSDTVITAVVAVGLSIVLFLWFEKPSQKWLLRTFTGRCQIRLAA